MDEILAYKYQLISGTITTVQLALVSVSLSIVLGLIGALAKLSNNLAAQKIASGYTTTVRGVPDLVLMLLLYFGGQQLLNRLGAATELWGYIEINEFAAGVIAIGTIFGAYMTETFRGAILAIPKGQIEAAVACGMNRHRVFRRIIWPQLIQFALPGFTNNWLVLIKSTALVSVIGLSDLVFNALSAGRATRQMFTFMSFVFVTYLILTAISELGLQWFSRRYRKYTIN